MADLPLEEWARNRWGEKAPSIFTLRSWARNGKIYPYPEKIGRAYFVKPDAEYCRDHESLARRLNVTSPPR
jgi:Excisionase-like protein